MPLSRLALVSSKYLCPLEITSSRMKPLIRSTVLCQHLTVGSFVRHLSSSPHLNVHREVTVPKDFPTSGIAINTRVRKLNFPPFVKDLYCGVFNKSVLSFAEVLNYGRHYNLEEKVRDIGGYIEGKKEVLAQTDGSGKLPPEVLHAFKQSGMFGLSVPTEYGGADFLSTEIARIFEVLGCEISLAEFMNYNEFLGGCQVLMSRGTEEQKQKYLPELTSGSMLGSLCVAEEGSGSDPASVETLATKSEDEDVYILNGTKTWVVGGADAGLFTVLAKLKMKNYLGEDDVLDTAFLVERGFGGIEVSEPRRLAGLKGLDLVDVTFKDVKVPLGNVLGVEGEGLQVLASIVHQNKYMMAAGLVTHLRGLLDETITWCNDRKQFGLHLREFTLVKHQIAQMAARLYCLESMIYLTSGLQDVAEVPDVELESVLVKLYAAETSEFITKGCLNLLGLRAAMEESKYQRYLRDNQVVQSWQGTANILKCFVAVTGAIHLSEAEKDISKLRHPGTNLGGLFSYQWGTRQHRSDSYPLKHQLKSCVHPRLIKAADQVEWSVLKLHWVAKELLLKSGANLQVEEKYLERLSDITMETYAQVCALSRASRSYVVGHQHAEHEINMVIPYIFESRLRVKENAWKCVNHTADYGNRDEFWEATGDYILKRGNYCATHPLAKNSF